MDNKISEIEQDIAKEIKVDRKGHGSISGRGLARLLGINHTAILRGERFPAKLAETLTQQGINPGDRPFSDVALALIAEYYAYEAQKTTEQAKQVYRTLAAIGARTWMQKVTGWKEPNQMVRLSRQRMGELMTELQAQMNLKDHIEDYPGYEEIVEHGEVTGAIAEEDPLVPVATLLDRWGVAYDHKSLSAIGMYVATQYRNAKHEKPVRKRTKPVVGKKGWGMANYYPESWLEPVLKNALEAEMT